MIEENIINLVDWIVDMPLWVIYSFFFLIAYLENVFPPIPGDILVVFGGYLAIIGIVDFAVVLGITTVGSVLGFMSLYYVGYRVGDEIRTKHSRFRFLKFIDNKYMNKAELWMYRWGQGVILANRFLAGTRSIISLVAGISKTNTLPTIVSATISALLWNSILITLGWYIGESWPAIQKWLNYYGTSILGLLAIFIIWKFAVYIYKKNKLRKKRKYPEV
jgi:membrane protein DedA with SNARE-associated domain